VNIKKERTYSSKIKTDMEFQEFIKQLSKPYIIELMDAYLEAKTGQHSLTHELPVGIHDAIWQIKTLSTNTILIAY
jgi:hypothetical protein